MHSNARTELVSLLKSGKPSNNLLYYPHWITKVSCMLMLLPLPLYHSKLLPQSHSFQYSRQLLHSPPCATSKHWMLITEAWAYCTCVSLFVSFCFKLLRYFASLCWVHTGSPDHAIVQLYKSIIPTLNWVILVSLYANYFWNFKAYIYIILCRE